MPIIRVTIPIRMHEKLRMEQAKRNRKEYRPLNPSPPSGFVEVAWEISGEAHRALKAAMKQRRASGENVTMSDLVVESIRAADLRDIIADIRKRGAYDVLADLSRRPDGIEIIDQLVHAGVLRLIATPGKYPEGWEPVVGR